MFVEKISYLNEKEKNVIILRFGLEDAKIKTLEELKNYVYFDNVSSCYNKARLKLRRYFRSNEVKEEKMRKFPEDLEVLELSEHAYNCLMRAGICSLDAFKALTKEEIWKMRNMGTRTCKEVINKQEELKQKSL